MFWYENEIKQLEAKAKLLGTKAKSLFYGSSSIRQWESLENDLAELQPANLGFGGSTLAACVWFFDRVMVGYEPERLIIYAGDNDLGDGRHPEEIFIFFQQLAVRVKERFGDIDCYYISLKPSPSRWHLVDQFRFTNSLIEQEIAKHLHNWKYVNLFDKMIGADAKPRYELFQHDGLHLSNAGYRLWTDVMTQMLHTEA